MKAAVTRDAATEGLPGEPGFGVAATPMRLRTGIDQSRLHDLDASLEIATFKALTARLEQEVTR